MENLELIEEKINNSEKLSLEDLKVLYEDIDERRNSLVKRRNVRLDLSRLYDCDISKVCLQNRPAYCDDCRVYYGNMNFITMRFAYDLKFPKLVMGNLNLRNLKKAVNVVFPEEVMGNLNLSSLTEMENCTLPKIVRGNLLINSFEELDKLVLPDVVLGKIVTFYGIGQKEELDKYIEKFIEEKSCDGRKR